MKTVLREWACEDLDAFGPFQVFEHAGLTCLVVFCGSSTAHWNGYVALPKSHRLHGVDYNNLPPLGVHGGVTFSGTLRSFLTEKPWWVGFDTAHLGDELGSYLEDNGRILFEGLGRQAEPRRFQYVKEETMRLASQLAKLAKKPAKKKKDA